jgi:diadenylate cyclase
VITTGTIVDAMTTHELVVNVFFPMSPLHDGAAVIREGRIFAAGCILPLTQTTPEPGTWYKASRCNRHE